MSSCPHCNKSAMPYELTGTHCDSFDLDEVED